MQWDDANALWAICAPTAAPTDYGAKPGPPIHPIHLLDNGYDTQDRLKKRSRPEMGEGTVVRQACFEKMDAKTEEEDASANVGAQQT